MLHVLKIYKLGGGFQNHTCNFWHNIAPFKIPVQEIVNKKRIQYIRNMNNKNGSYES